MDPQRRLLLASIAAAPFALAGCESLGDIASLLGNQFFLSQLQIQNALNGSFPKRYDKLGGLASLNLTDPRLTIPQDSNRLRLDLGLGLSLLGSKTATGSFGLSSGVRFDARTLGIHLDGPAIETVNVPALGGALNDNVRGALNTWLAGYARDEPIYKFDDSLLARIGSRHIASTGIANGQVVVNLQ
jgi:hypothetical protein